LIVVSVIGAAGGEVHAAIFAEIGRGQCQQSSGEFFSWRGMELRRMRKSNLRGLFSHRGPNFPHAVTDVDNGSLARRIQEPSAV
jgi:hypothetical protein